MAIVTIIAAAEKSWVNIIVKLAVVLVCLVTTSDDQFRPFGRANVD